MVLCGVTGQAKFRAMLQVILLVLVVSLGSQTASAAECYEDSSQSECKDYIYPDSSADADLNILCGSSTGMPNMPGCTIRRACEENQINSTECEPFSLLGDICDKDPGMNSMNGCQNYTELCMSSGSVVKQCSDTPPWENVISTHKATTDAAGLCDEDDSHSACDDCTSTVSCSDPLLTLSSVCPVSANSTHCENWCTMCASTSDMDELCSNKTSCPGQTSNSSDDCIEDSSQASCVDYLYPLSRMENDLNKLCTSMPQMIGCSVLQQCEGGQASGMYCDPMSILQDICLKDPGMSTMTGCENVVQLCGQGSMVDQCSSNSAIPNVLGTMSTQEELISACSQMNMDGCDLCVSMSDCPDPLLGMSKMCMSMWMDECSDWKTMCDSLSSEQKENLAVFCGSSDPALATPVMRMYFHTGILDYILFESWVPRNGFQYAASIVAMLAMGVTSVAMKAWRNVYEAREELSEKDFAGIISPAGMPVNENGNTPVITTEPACCKQERKRPSYVEILQGNFPRAVFSLVITTLDYLLMLAAMTFNVGIFISVVGGIALGTLLIGHIGKEKSVDSVCCG